MTDRTQPSLDRRALLSGAAAASLLPFLPPVAGAAAAAPLAPGIHIVDGWVLTSDDLRALGLHAR